MKTDNGVSLSMYFYYHYQIWIDIGSLLHHGLSSLYIFFVIDVVYIKACGRVRVIASDWFSVGVGLRDLRDVNKAVLISILFMDEMVRDNWNLWEWIREVFKYINQFLFVGDTRGGSMIFHYSISGVVIIFHVYYYCISPQGAVNGL